MNYESMTSVVKNLKIYTCSVKVIKENIANVEELNDLLDPKQHLVTFRS